MKQSQAPAPISAQRLCFKVVNATARPKATLSACKGNAAATLSLLFMIYNDYHSSNVCALLLLDTGQDRTGQDRTGQDRTGQDRTGPRQILES